MAAPNSQVPRLQEQLEAHKRAFFASIPAVVVGILRKTTAELVRSGIAEQALRVGDRAPNFALPDPLGRVHSLPSLLAAGPVVLTFYRGVW